MAAVVLPKAQERSYDARFVSLVTETDKALQEFNKVDARYMNNQATNDEYKLAWYKLNDDLTRIKRQKIQPDKVSKNFRSIVVTYNLGFDKVTRVVSGVTEFLKHQNNDFGMIFVYRQSFIEWQNMLREVNLQTETN